MDTNVIVDLLKRTLDPGVREAAEKEILKVQKIIGFCPALLQIVLNESFELPVRQSGAILLKNLICLHWSDKSYDPTKDPVAPFSLHEQDRAVIRDNMVEAMVRATEVLRLQLAICVSTIIKADFPGRWSAIVEKVSLVLETPEPLHWPGALATLYQLVKTYEYRKKEERGPLYEAMKMLLPQVYHVTSQCSNNNSQQATEIRKMILKIFFSLTQYTLPLELLNQSVFTQWMEVCNSTLVSPVPDSEHVDVNERPTLIWWKEKKWAMHILTRIFERYGSPGNVVSEYTEFADWYIKTFSCGILDSVLKILSDYSKNIYVSPRVLQQALNYVNTAVSHGVTWKLVKPHMTQITQDIVFPLMSYTEEDAELWESDPYEYIRIKFDIFEDFVSPVTAAQTLLHSVCKKRRDVLPSTMEMLLKVLQNPTTTAAQRDGALHMIGTLADILLKKKAYKEKMEEFLVQIVFPEFSSSYGHLRARACWMLHYFADVKYKNQNILIESFNLTIKSLLHDAEAPVKVEAAIALQMMLSHHDEVAKSIVEPQIGNITMELLKIIRDTENDDLTSVMQKIICTYTDQLAPLAVDICNHLVATFAQVLDSGDAGDEKAITAMGLLNTMETLLSVMENETIHSALEPVILQAVNHIFSNSISEFYEEAISLACDLTSKKISSHMWQLLLVVYEVFNRDGIDYFTDMMPLLHNYVTVDTTTLLSNVDYLTALFNMCRTMLESEPGEDPECHAAKLLEVIILQCQGRGIENFMVSAVELVITRMQKEIKTSELRTMCLQVAIATLYCDSNLFFATLEKCGGEHAVMRRFIDQWINDTDCFVGLHDRKLCILGMCRLLQLPNVPGVSENASRFLPSLILLFEGLKRAYEMANDSDTDGASSSDESADEEELESDEDEIDEKSQMYLESLQKAVLSGTGDKIKVTTALEYESDSDEEGLYEETSLESFTTPLDEDSTTVDEYTAFKVTLEALKSSHSDWYIALTSNLTEDNQKHLEGIYLLCEQRKAMKESKTIEEAGGYNFNQQAVPSQFSFTDTSKFQFGETKRALTRK